LFFVVVDEWKRVWYGIVHLGAGRELGRSQRNAVGLARESTELLSCLGDLFQNFVHRFIRLCGGRSLGLRGG
jgi:hypothetical protein